ncbi:uncharacterized protein BO95DRAFT_438136 [Aspergillus brunneoviolaceus CBS 621.78]|uniref:Uncharacterized protein n=1 Tax=Aspergillus brunneoviolaceus CBS 621.78 TaxID=1450534 RepID=A0ACD1GNL8_9EURO|nr:hypothetical protein BO95DRAFT_438136 [Aspergillus brunneoviolaceus CBS 621.78]RAH50874.1 hypothetical protein BO95DRAFT_438136 [Aspergillus brunneoviolaceus CBS 621.78]
MPMTWNEAADAKLLTAILQTINTKLDYPRIAQLMGPECTIYAIQHRLRSLRERARSGPTAADGPPALPSTPTRDSTGGVDPASAHGTPASGPRKRGRPPKVKVEADGSAEAAPMTPKKRGRAKKVKAEEMEEEAPHATIDTNDGSQPVYQSIEDAYMQEAI